MREMHGPAAVGKKVSVEFDDDNKTISLTARVSKGAPDTWEKVLDGTLSFFSIGGSGKKVIEKQASGKTATRVFLNQLAEVSFVDNGACPTAKFEICKSIDGHLVDVEPVDPEVADDPIVKATDAIDEAIAEAATPVMEPSAACALAKSVVRGTITKEDVIKQAAAAGPEDVDQALQAVSFLNRLLANEYWEARSGADIEGADKSVEIAQVGMLKSAIDSVLQFLQSEYEEQFDPTTLPAAAVSDDAGVEMFVKALALVRKAGARHSKNDLGMIQKVHDLSGTLGANCAAQKAVVVPVPEVEPVVVDTTNTGGGEDLAIVKAELLTATAAMTDAQAIVAKQAETIAALDTRLKTIEAQPLPGGPMLRAGMVVEKSIGGSTEAQPHETVLAAFDTLAAAAKTDGARMEVVTKKLSFMREHQLNAINPITGRTAAE
jgi:hypothetical protein